MIVTTVNTSINIKVASSPSPVLPINAVWYDVPTSNFATGSYSATISNTAWYEIVAPIESGSRREVQCICLYNADNVTHDVTVAVQKDGIYYTVVVFSVAPSYSLHYSPETGWYIKTSTGANPPEGGGTYLEVANNLSDVANAATALSNLGGASTAYVDAKVATTITNGVTTSAPNQNAVYDALYEHENTWKTVALGNVLLASAAVTAADVYWHTNLGQTSLRQNVASSNPPAFTYLKSSDYVSAIGLTPKLRIKVSLMAVNDTAPARTLTVGLYPCNSPTSGTTGGAGLRQYASGTVVTGSNSIAFASPAADTMTFDQATSSFTFPSDGLYSIATDVSGALTANSAVHIIAELQLRFE
jgi:hypothetical protein